MAPIALLVIGLVVLGVVVTSSSDDSNSSADKKNEGPCAFTKRHWSAVKLITGYPFEVSDASAAFADGDTVSYQEMVEINSVRRSFMDNVTSKLPAGGPDDINFAYATMIQANGEVQGIEEGAIIPSGRFTPDTAAEWSRLNAAFDEARQNLAEELLGCNPESPLGT